MPKQWYEGNDIWQFEKAVADYEKRKLRKIKRALIFDTAANIIGFVGLLAVVGLIGFIVWTCLSMLAYAWHGMSL